MKTQKAETGYALEDNSLAARMSRIKDTRTADGYIRVIMAVFNEILNRK